MTQVAAVEPTGPRVFAAIAAVMSDLAKDGIAKTQKNQQQGYSFRGIDAIYNELSPILARHNLLMLPRVLTREVTERVTQKGGALFYVVVEAEFDLICADDASKHTIRTFGEAMDSADKATNKAMSAAYKYAAMQAFCIPTEGDNDADGTSHTVQARKTLSSQHAKTIIKTDVIQAMIDGASTVKEANDAAARITEYSAFMPAAWINAFRERLEHQMDLIAKGGVVDEPAGVDAKAMLTRSVAMEDMAAKLKAAKSAEDLGAIWDAEVEGKFTGDARNYLIDVYENALNSFGVAAN
jgi:hypothetical protein